MEAARLNVDVLAVVCEFLTDVPDVLSFSLICSALRPPAIKHLLSVIPISLISDASIRRFHFFLFADVSARAPHIRALELGSQPRHAPKTTDKPGRDSFLIDILASCSHLERISLSPKCTSLQPGADGPGDPYIANSTTPTPGKRNSFAHTFLPMVRAPLRRLTIRTINPEALHWTPAALEAFLPPFAPTLEKLELRDFFIDITDTRGLDGSPPSQSTPPLTQYPAVRSLSVRSLEGAPLIDVLLHLFPALDGTLCLDEWGKTTFLSSFEHIRATNQEAQQRRGNSTWKKLDRLVCEPALFYMLGLRCPIGLLMIKDCTEEMTDDLAMGLRENPVPRLKLSLILDPGLRVLDVLPSARLGDTLTHLTLCLVDIRVNEDVYDTYGMTPSGPLRWDDILDGMRASLELLQKLSHLRVVIHCNFFDDAPELVTLVALRQCEAVDLEGFASSLVRMLPSLRFFFFTMSAWFGNTIDVKDRWHVVRAWHAVDSPANDTGAGRWMQDGRLTLVDLTDKDAAAIIEKEELVLSDVEEIELQIPKD